tara:strand:- start:2990 stop:3229 length:240 start_codon:yes stop_codon:yes gene_type:complete
LQIFNYAVVPVTAVTKLFLLSPDEREAAVKEEPRLKSVQDLLRSGFRWVRTEGTLAVFEKNEGVYSYTVEAEHFLGLTN